jgi:hypothetical protein
MQAPAIAAKMQGNAAARCVPYSVWSPIQLSIQSLHIIRTWRFLARGKFSQKNIEAHAAPRCDLAWGVGTCHY